jgi:FtsZ-binding cell division protein ZapB
MSADSQSPTSKRIRLSEGGRESQLQDEIDRLRLALEDAEGTIFDQRCRISDLDDIVDTAEHRVEVLQMEVIDLRESNEQYAVAVQRQAVQLRERAARLQRLDDELLSGIERHGREISRLTARLHDTAVPSGPAAAVACLVCNEERDVYHALPCCSHALCAACSAMCRRCPFCRAEAEPPRASRVAFRRWW